MDFTPGALLDNTSAGRAAELIPDGLVAADGEGRVIFLNTRATRLIGRSREDLVGSDIRESVDLRDGDGSSWWATTNPWGGLRIRSGHREKLLLLSNNGREVLVTAKYLRPGRSQPVNRVNILMRDASYRRRAEAENAAVISTVAHELRSPLTSVKGFSSTLLKRWDRFTDDQKRLMLETIEADADRVTRLITELLDVSRIDSGRLQVRPLPVDVGAVFDRHVDRAVASGIERDRFAVSVADDLPEVWADPDRLDQILSNLLENAVRHGEGVVTLAAAPAAQDARAAMAAKGRGEVGVELFVSDEGKGIPDHHRELVFSRFWHGSGRGSTGLGLYVVKGLVEAHGGRVVVESAPSGGAQFRLSLPSQPPEYLA
jgi:PAS domain S-box-containing protein